eukprot:scaffold67675_cov65-Phaeocystis_antarctica.AAC.1
MFVCLVQSSVAFMTCSSCKGMHVHVQQLQGGVVCRQSPVSVAHWSCAAAVVPQSCEATQSEVREQ